MSALVLDLSSNDIGLTDPVCLAAAGVTGVVCGVYGGANPPHDMIALGDRCAADGVPVIGTYGLAYFGDPYGSARDIYWAVQAAQYHGARTVWIDVEADAIDAGWQVPRPLPGVRLQELARCRAIIEDAGLQPGIYTGRYWWLNQMANSTDFADLPLWLSSYGVGGYPGGPITAVDFGGWNQLAAHQFTSMWGAATGNNCGRPGGARDASYWYREEDFMPALTTADVEAIVNRVIYDKEYGGEIVGSTSTLECIAQIVDVHPSTYTDPAAQAVITAIRAKLGLID